MPFSSLYWGSEFNAASDVLRKVLFFMPIGALAAAGIWGLKLSRRGRWMAFAAALLYTGCVSWAIEMVQVFLPPHMSDETDVLLAVAGGGVGLLLTWRALASQDDLSLTAAVEEMPRAAIAAVPANQISAGAGAP
ncbi:MAG: VanZ family protein [Planctomycetia bacterium]|nr:VanZ family protein [Planctomycetia bacterium]